jgi:predicted metal-dependent phosphoesterase TrpH
MPNSATPDATRSSISTINVDLHIHSSYSRDSLTSLEEIIATAQQRGLGALAILDHNTIAGGLALREIAPFPVIVGEEVMTTAGEIAGLFLSKEIPKGLSPQETVARIHEQGGLVYVPHPFDSLRKSRLEKSALMAILDEVDILEVLNARVVRPADNERARLFAEAHGLPGAAGSDAHAPVEIASAYVEMAPFEGSDSFLRSLAQGSPRGSESPAHVHLFSTWAKIRKLLSM